MASDHLSGGTWGINFRVTDLDAMVTQLRAGGNEVTVDPELYPNDSPQTSETLALPANSSISG